MINAPVAASPTHKLNILANYTLPLAEGVGAIKLSLNYSYTSKYTVADNAIYDPVPETQAGFSLLDMRLDWNNVMNNPVDLSFFVKNVFDKLYITGAGVVINSRLASTSAIYSEPRTFGMQARVRFGASAD